VYFHKLVNFCGRKFIKMFRLCILKEKFDFSLTPLETYPFPESCFIPWSNRLPLSFLVGLKKWPVIIPPEMFNKSSFS